MKGYKKYKNTDFEWIGNIPEHWTVGALKHCFSFKVGFTPPTSNGDYYSDSDGYDWVTISDMDNRIIEESKRKLTQDGIDSRSAEIVPKGSLLYSFKLSVGKVAFAGKPLFTNEAILSILPADELELSYYYYCLPVVLIHNANENIYGAKIFNQEVLKNSRLPIPSLSEQTQIAQYLDYQTAIIDELIKQKEKLIELLNEQRQAVINETVTKGLNPTAKMKDSGIEWLGDIPTDWDIVNLRYLCDITTGDKDTENREDDGEYPFFVRSQKVERISTYTFDGEAILTAGDGVGVCKVWHYIQGKFDFHQRVYMMSNFKEVSGKFLFYYMRENFINDVLKLSAKSTVDSLRRPMFLNFKVVVPTVEEQMSIVNFIETFEDKMSLLIMKETTVIEKLKEYRQSIISEAVTGKIDVRDWQPEKESV